MMSIKRQQGLSSTGWLFVIAVFGAILTIVAKLAPFYLDNRVVVATLNTLAEDSAFPSMAPNQVRSKLQKTFTINAIRGKPLQALKVTKKKNVMLVTVAYEERVNIVFNIDAVLTFNNVLDSTRPEECCSPPTE